MPLVPATFGAEEAEGGLGADGREAAGREGEAELREGVEDREGCGCAGGLGLAGGFGLGTANFC